MRKWECGSEGESGTANAGIMIYYYAPFFSLSLSSTSCLFVVSDRICLPTIR